MKDALVKDLILLGKMDVKYLIKKDLYSFKSNLIIINKIYLARVIKLYIINNDR